MCSHFIHYVPRRVVLRFPQDPDDPWFAGVRALGDGFVRPQYHVTRRDDGPAAAVEAGDTIWIVGELASPWGRLGPALDSRINVAEVEHRPGGERRYRAAQSSCWFPLADVSTALAEVQTADREGVIRPLRADRTRPIGHYLQSIRRLASAEPLESWARQLRPDKMHFVSYRICDGTRAAFEKVRSLLNEGDAVFWDRWCLPRRLAERRECVSDAALDAYLMQKLEQAAVVWGIESRLYALSGSYSAREQSRAKELGKYCRVYQRLPVRPESSRGSRPSDSPGDILGRNDEAPR